MVTHCTLTVDTALQYLVALLERTLPFSAAVDVVQRSGAVLELTTQRKTLAVYSVIENSSFVSTNLCSLYD